MKIDQDEKHSNNVSTSQPFLDSKYLKHTNVDASNEQDENCSALSNTLSIKNQTSSVNKSLS